MMSDEPIDIKDDPGELLVGRSKVTTEIVGHSRLLYFRAKKTKEE
jgi:hypothetical protein